MLQLKHQYLSASGVLILFSAAALALLLSFQRESQSPYVLKAEQAGSKFDENTPELPFDDDHYSKDWAIPKGIGYYHKANGKPKWSKGDDIDRIHRGGHPFPFRIRKWGNSKGFNSNKKSADEIPRGIGYYHPAKSREPAVNPSKDPEPKEKYEDGDLVPKGLGFYGRSLPRDYPENHLRDPTYYYQAHRLAYPELPDEQNRAQFVPPSWYSG
mmetsp:Transcript_16609/g.25803  ORF Transcript_16609/g.25803 Transcript_16609/m.25803 type:complete len:213 (-) Transcript_16609:1033-1671(-)